MPELLYLSVRLLTPVNLVDPSGNVGMETVVDEGVWRLVAEADDLVRAASPASAAAAAGAWGCKCGIVAGFAGACLLSDFIKGTFGRVVCPFDPAWHNPAKTETSTIICTVLQPEQSTTTTPPQLPPGFSPGSYTPYTQGW